MLWNLRDGVKTCPHKKVDKNCGFLVTVLKDVTTVHTSPISFNLYTTHLTQGCCELSFDLFKIMRFRPYNKYLYAYRKKTYIFRKCSQNQGWGRRSCGLQNVVFYAFPYGKQKLYKGTNVVLYLLIYRLLDTLNIFSYFLRRLWTVYWRV